MGLPFKRNLINRLRAHSEQLADRMVRRMDADTSEDARLVMDAAAALQIREFDVFVQAYRRWRDRDPLPDRIEDVFAAYMFAQQVPAYVRQFAREAVKQERAGTLDPADFGIEHPAAAGPDPRGPLLVWGTIACIIGFCGLLIATPVDAGRGGGLFCDRGPGSSYVATVARTFTGKTDPFRCRR